MTTSRSDRHCRLCGETKPIQDFPRHRARKDGIGSACLACCRLRSKAWRQQRQAQKTPTIELSSPAAIWATRAML